MAGNNIIVTLSAEKRRLREVESALEEVRKKLRVLRSEQASLENEKKTLEQTIKSQVVRQDGQEFRGSNFPWSEKIGKLRMNGFGIKAFRGLQETAINCILSGKDCILIMPTGGGKSLTYQLPCAYLRGLTVVITPLVSLMEDQVMQVRARCCSLPVACLHAQLPREESSSILKRMTFPSADENALLLYVTPERLAKSKLFMTKLQKCWELKKLKLIAIDEVHCCSQWGHDFRPDYTYLGILKKQFPGVPILGLTATASRSLASDVIEMLSLDDDLALLRDSFDRPNLRYCVERAPHDIADAIGTLIKTRYRNQTGIVYCFSTKESEDVATQLTAKHGITAYSYHASLESERRSKIHRKWSAGKIQVMVATVAFGMGIDKADVRFVIHHSIPKSMENYYQESGRAGRDGLPADCIMFFRFQDIFRQSSMVYAEKKGVKNLYSVVAYCLDQSRCRRSLLAEYFSENSNLPVCFSTSPDQQSSAVSQRSICDNCAHGRQQRTSDVSNLVKIMSQTLEEADINEVRLTGNKLVEALRKKSKDRNPLPKERLEELVSWCLCQSYLEEKFHFTPYSTIPFLSPGLKMSDVISGREHALMECVSLEGSSGPSRASSVVAGGKRKRSPDVIAIEHDD
ncbi:putative ATP-dependent DNA helicase Q1-like [Tropilaelaps mercedesae]|uniref:ATP-dependent DNA helicase n=1 Tax=Tropilaelaps mercedesae TaxID=418985 RepID=A0A1V9Y0U6_9ACAR|nr:putative ATP-dependent DNA helicase Q1-like [Tropilaelaps mercedesae]